MGEAYNFAFVDVAGFVEEGVHCVWWIEGCFGTVLSFWSIAEKRLWCSEAGDQASIAGQWSLFADSYSTCYCYTAELLLGGIREGRDWRRHGTIGTPTAWSGREAWLHVGKDGQRR